MHKSKLLPALCLEGLFLDSFEIKDQYLMVCVRSPRTSASCPHCSRSSHRVYKTSKRRVKHAKWDERLVILELTIRSFMCLKCPSGHQWFQESLPGIDQRRTTQHFRESMLPKLRNRSFRDVAQEHAISTMQLLRSTVDLMKNAPIPWPDTPFALGIDEHSFAGRDLVITLTDLTHHRLLAILKDDQQSSLRKWLKDIPDTVKILIFAVCTDMRQSYRSVLEQEWSEIPLVVDHFHVIQYLNWHMGQLRQIYTSSEYPLPKKLLEQNKEDVNKKDQAQLTEIFERFPPLQELWKLKECVRNIYRLKDSEAAEERLTILLQGLRLDRRPRWQAIWRTLNHWKIQILNYFVHHITNAYTEGVHTRIKLLKRISYGFRNKTNYIAKMTLAFMPLITLLELLKQHPIC